MRAWNQNRLFNYVIPQVMKKNWLQTTANEIVIMVLIHLPNSKNLSNLIKSEFCPLFKLSLLVFLVSKIENLCCSVELPCVSYHWELSSIKISKISFFEFLDIFHQNQPECVCEMTFCFFKLFSQQFFLQNQTVANFLQYKRATLSNKMTYTFPSRVE